MCYRSGDTPALFIIFIDIHNRFGTRHLGFPSSTYSWRYLEHCRVVLGPRKYRAGRCYFLPACRRGRAAIGYIKYRPSDIDHRFGGRHIGFPGAAGMEVFRHFVTQPYLGKVTKAFLLTLSGSKSAIKRSVWGHFFTPIPYTRVNL